MKKLFLLGAVFTSITASAQTLFYYGQDSVSSADFVQAYRKNNSNTKSEAAFKEYLDLYIASRLKIKEAVVQGYDTLPQFVSDLQGLRAQIMPQYLNDKAAVDKLINEAFSRSQKDIRLSHIFISFQQNGQWDTTAAQKKRDDVLNALKAGSFSDVAKKFSDDPSAKNNGGEMGWITVFNLPYALENLAYSTPVGKTSEPLRSKAGYHIFKNMGERKALGKVKAAQILIAFPPDADETTKAQAKKQADSVYNRLQKGDDFGIVATAISNDIISAASGGQIKEFGVGEYEPAFEKVVFALPKGSISKPFSTAHGYHIVKSISKIAVSAMKDVKTVLELHQKVESSDRILWAKKAFTEKILREAKYQPAVYNANHLWLYTDSVLDGRKPTNQTALQASTPLFNLGRQTVTARDWTNYAAVYRYKQDGSGLKPYDQLWNDFIEVTATEFYQNNLEEFNPAFKKQINEFKDGNLFFEIMQKQVWEPAQTDTAALKSFYEKNASRYKWNKSASAVLFFATDLTAANDFIKELKKDPSNWNTLLANYSEKIVADSGRFEWDQITNTAKNPVRNGLITSPVINTTDNTASFAYIIQTHDKPGPKTFIEAKGQVISDYQAELEKQWMQQLTKKYPVRINQKELDALIKKKSW